MTSLVVDGKVVRRAVWTGACEVALAYHSVYRVGGFSRSAGADPFRRRATFGLPDGRAATGDGHTGSEPWSMHGSAGYAAWAGRYLAEFGASREDFGRIAINGRTNAAANPNAVLREPLTMAGYRGRPDDPRAAVPVRHGRAGRRGGRVHRDHRRTGP